MVEEIMRLTNSISNKIIGIFCFSQVVVIVVIALFYTRSVVESEKQLDRAIRKGNLIAMESAIQNCKQSLEKQLISFLNSDEPALFIKNPQDDKLRMLLDGLFISLKNEHIGRMTIYNKSLHVLLQAVSKDSPKRPDILPEYLHPVFQKSAEDFSYHFYFRGKEDLRETFPVEYCGVAAITDADDNLIGFVEITKRPTAWVKPLTEIVHYPAGIYDASTKLFSYTTQKELFAELLQGLSDFHEGDSSRILQVSRDYIYADIIPISNYGGKVDSWLFLTKNYTEQVLSKRKNLIAVGVILTGLLVCCIGATIVILKQYIIRPINRIVGFVDKLRQGDLSDHLVAGKQINCSVVRNCNVSDCTCFGKPARCWEEAGLWSSKPTCPCVLNGKDCRDCTIYKAARMDELDEICATLNGVVDGLKAKAKAALEISKGDLRQSIYIASEKDTLGAALQQMIHRLGQIIVKIQQAGDQVTAGSQQVASSSQALSQGATEQASSLQEITSTMVEIGNQTKINAEHAANAEHLSRTVTEIGRNGAEQMQDMVSAMSGINESGMEIQKIIKVIDDIAFQTNLLALNAAVEAARAGKHGKGFAVVAQEVRTLAARSAKAAKESEELIKGSVIRVKHGNSIVEKTAAALKEMVDGIEKVSQIIKEISVSSNEQSQSIAQINEGLMQIDGVTQINSASAEETASASDELASQATIVRQLLSTFRMNGSDAEELTAISTAQPYSDKLFPQQAEFENFHANPVMQ